MAASKLKRISISVSPEERETIERGAAIAGISLARFVVDAGLRAAEVVLQTKAFSLELKAPNAQTRAAMEEARAMMKARSAR